VADSTIPDPASTLPPAKPVTTRDLATAIRPAPKSAGPPAEQIGEAINLVKDYVVQETVGPLIGMGRKILFGVMGAVAMGAGLFFISLGLLRLIQDKLPRIATGSLSWISYLIVIVFSVGVSALALWRVKKIEKELN
jgi:hypothetical protein